MMAQVIQFLPSVGLKSWVQLSAAIFEAQFQLLWHLGSEPSVGSSLSLLLKCTKDNFLLWPPFKAIQEILAVCLHSDIFLYSWQKQDFMYMKRVLRFVSTPWWSISAEIFALSQCLLLSQILESQLCRPCHYLCMGYFFSLCVYIGGSFESLFFQLMNDLVDRTMGSTVQLYAKEPASLGHGTQPRS